MVRSSLTKTNGVIVGLCRSAIFAEMKEEVLTTSHPINNPYVTTRMETTSTSSSSVVMSSTSASVSSIAALGKQKNDVPADYFGERLHSTMSRRKKLCDSPRSLQRQKRQWQNIAIGFKMELLLAWRRYELRLHKPGGRESFAENYLHVSDCCNSRKKIEPYY